MSIVGYARVSSIGQSLVVQLDKLEAHGCDKVFQEKASGATDNRPQLKRCLEYVRTGDTLVITKLDRLARSTLHLTQIADQLKQRGVELIVLDQAIDTSTPTGKLLFNMLASIAEFETAIRSERQLDGIARAKANGVEFGRKAALSSFDIIELRNKRESGSLIRELMKEYGLSKATVYRYLSKPTLKAGLSDSKAF
jgi:DNA invertase Pin-like site-specific DNA recombinase